MIPSKAYIIRISTDLSRQYAADAAKSCELIGLPYEYVDGYENMTTAQAWKAEGYSFPSSPHRFSLMTTDKASCCTVSHISVWKKILEKKECAIVLEHDAIMLHKLDLNVPDDVIVTLGYKLRNPEKYNHITAGPPKSIAYIDGHEGAHAYAMTWKTAEDLLDELNRSGPRGPIDNVYFLKTRRTKVRLAIADPTPAIAWIRKSTIWNEAAERNYKFVSSFENHLDP